MGKSYPYEKLGLFYLGRERDLQAEGESSMPLLLKSKNLTTHAAIIGMTGSGKTGLGIGLIEEAIMDNIPSIIIDPKGDMGNLLLSFPTLQASEFKNWIDPAEADKKGKTVEEFAAQTAEIWGEGLASWEQSSDRIASLRQKTTFTIYTPGSSAGVAVSVLDSFDAPTEDVLADNDTFNDLVNSVVSGLLSLVGFNDDENTSREYVFLSSIFIHFWRKGEGLTLENVIGSIVNPPLKKIGVFGLDTFYPQKERMELAMKFNSVIASPAFSGWTQGEPLDIQKILYGTEGTPQTAIFSIAHLGEAERMFFVTMLLNKMVDWMRRQQGSSSLKALLYMDEIFGYFPPTANPPSKKPMLLLLKQARAYGVGVVLATQNPVDLDYKGLSNIGTWFIGRLQTSQDQKRVIDGLVGAGDGALDKKSISRLLSDLKGRQFVLRSAHLDEVLLFETRWVMSYLKGPISLPDIERLMAERKKQSVPEEHLLSSYQHDRDGSEISNHPPLISDKIEQRFYLHPIAVESYLFEPWLAGTASVRFYNAKRNIDEVKQVRTRLYLDERFTEPDWPQGEDNPYADDDLQLKPFGAASYYPLPAALSRARDLRGFNKSFADHLYYNTEMELFRAATIGLESQPGESLADFKIRLGDVLREEKEAEIDKLEDKFAHQRERVEKQLERAELKVEKEKSDVRAKTTDTILSFGAAVFGAFFGRKRVSVSTISKASTGIKNAGRLAREKGQVKQAEQAVLNLEEDMRQLVSELEAETTQLAEKYDPERHPIETFSIKPRRSDVFDLDLYLLWEMVAQNS